MDNIYEVLWYNILNVSQKWFNILVHINLRYEYYSTKIVQILITVVVTIMVVGILTCCALLHSVCDLKAAQIYVQYHLIWELMLYEFEPGHNAMEATKIIYWATGEDAVEHNTVTRWIKKFVVQKVKMQLITVQ